MLHWTIEKTQADNVPNAIRVSMLVLRLRARRQASAKKGQPMPNTAMVASTGAAHCSNHSGMPITMNSPKTTAIGAPMISRVRQSASAAFWASRRSSALRWGTRPYPIWSTAAASSSVDAPSWFKLTCAMPVA